ncbi:MAG: MFS transporter [Propioniciclava sp.]|uniref:MFS transporter n=1 Tax=Propioniciclava sp. TaxID=2038686 RepID=UPI0039E6A4F6
MERQRRQSLFAGTVGNLVEWFDWSVYGFFVPFFASAFFPQGDAAARTLSALAVFAVGFFFRPLGGAILGSYADRHGRRAGMTLTILLMAGASAMIAVLPTYDQVGILAPVLLVVARCVQGFSAGGEFGTSAAFLVENAAPGHRAWAGSWQQVSVGAGTLLASAVASIMFTVFPPEFVGTWGWRIAFGLGAVLGLIGLWLRIAVPDTAAFTQARDQGRLERAPLRSVLREHPRAVLLVIAMICAGTALAQFWMVALPTILQFKTGIELRDAQVAAMVGLALFTVLQPVAGTLSDRFGRRPVLLFFALGSAVSFVPLLATVTTTLSSALVAASVSCVLMAG